MLKYIDTYGGPLLMLERELLPYWGGIDNIGGVAPHRLDGMTFNSDYERAGAVPGWVGPLRVRDRSGVVFWGDHLGLALERENDTAFLAVRPFYEIDDLRDIIKFVKENANCFEKKFEISFPSRSAIVFDSACPGLEIRDCLEIDILP
jgi:hypothetical protein